MHRDTAWSLVVSGLVLAFIGVMIRVSMTLNRPLEMSLWLVALGAFIGYLALTSIYIVRADKMVASFFLGDWEGTYISGTFATQRDRLGRTMEQLGGRRGLFGWNLAVLLYPFWRGVILPTGGLTLRVHVTRVYTRDDPPHSPSLPIHADSTINLGLTPHIGPLVLNFHLLSEGIDLTRKCEVHYTLERDEKDQTVKTGKYDGRVIEQILLRQAETLILEAIRVQGRGYPWRGDDDIRGNILTLERDVKCLLGRRESLFQQALLLNEFGLESLGARFFDLNIENIDVEDPRVRESLGQPTIAVMEAEAAKTRGEGEGRRLKRMSEESEIPADQIYQGEVAKEIDNITVFGGSETVTELLRSLFGGRRRR
jgi:hypothetical protein